jgi:hypothetical protein
MAMPPDLELRRARLKARLVPLVEAGQFCDPVPMVQEGAVAIDGLIDESVWPLACPEFYLDPESPTPDAPCFCFLTDGDNLFMGARYDLSGLDLSKLEPDSISLRVNLVSLLGDYSREARIRFLPLDSTGGADGRAFVDCPHYNQTISYDYASRVHENCWTLEFSIHMREVMGSSDRYLFYQLAFRNRLRSGGALCFYPVAEVGESPDGRKLVLAGYRNYFDLERS